MKHLLLASVVFSTIAAFPASALAEETIDLTISSGYPTTFIWAATMQDTFIPSLDKYLEEAGGEYKINWTEAFGGQLGGPGDQGELVEIGAADIGNVVIPLEQDILPLESVAYVVPFGTEDVSLATESVHAMRDKIPQMNDAWAAAGMKYLSAVSLDSYHLISNKPIDSVDDLNGLKIGAVGLNQTWIRNTGAAPVSITAVSVYTDMQTGVIDAVILTPSLMASSKVYEVARHLAQVNFGAIFQLSIAANLARWESLPAPVQDAIVKASDDWRKETVARLTEAHDKALKVMDEAGIEIRKLSPEARGAWAAALPNAPLDWAGDDAVRLQVVEAYISALRDAGTDLPRDWLADAK